MTNVKQFNKTEIAPEYSWSLRQTYKAIFKARINQNNAEIRELANIGTLKVLKLFDKSLARNHILDKDDIGNTIKKIIALEYYERSPHGPLMDIPNDLKKLYEIFYGKIKTADPEKIFHLDAAKVGKRIETIREKIIEILSCFKFETTTTDINPVLRVLLKYYFIFRSAQEEHTNLSNSLIKEWRKFKLESLLRAISYIEAGIKIDEHKIESHLIKARLFRELGLFTGNIRCLHASVDSLIKIYHGKNSVIANNCYKDNKPRNTDDFIAATSIIPDIFDDIGRVLEICYDIIKTKPPNSTKLPKEIKDNGLTGWLTIVTDIQSCKQGTHQNLLTKSNKAYRELINNYFNEQTQDEIPNTKKVENNISYIAKFWPDKKSSAIPLPQIFDNRADDPIDFLTIREDIFTKDKTQHEHELDYRSPDDLLKAAARFFILEYFLKDDCFWLFKKLCPENKNITDLKVAYPYPEVSLNNIGRILCKLDMKQCEEYYRYAIELNPNYAPAHTHLALFLLRDNQCVRAQRHLRTAKEILQKYQNPREEEFDINVGEIIVNENETNLELFKFLRQKKMLSDENNDKDSMAATLYVLRRWNSYTPILPGKPRSLGGGYFLVYNDKGTVIDPGYDFLPNFTHAGLSLQDIDDICITHLHADHIADLENIILLNYELKKRLGKKQKLKIFAGTNVIEHLKKRIDSLDYKNDFNVEIINSEEFNKINNNSPIKIKLNDSYHCEENSDKYRSTDLIFNFLKDINIGFTSDTEWHNELPEQYGDCSVLVAHLGQVYPKDLDKVGNIRSFNSSGEEEHFEKRNHLGLAGIKSLVDGIIEKNNNSTKRYPRLVIISEFGEELGVYRHKIARKLNKHYHNLGYTHINFITGDIDTIVKINNDGQILVRCEYCGINKYRRYDEMSDILLPADVPSNSSVKNICHRHDPDVILSQYQHKI